MSDGEPSEEVRQTIEEINEHLSDVLEREVEEGFLEELSSRVEEEKLGRVPERRKVSVLNWETDRATEPVSYGLKPPEGCVSVFFARRGTERLEELKSAYLLRNIERLEELEEVEIETYLDRPTRSVEEAVDEMLSGPAFFELSYDGRVLEEYLFTSETGVGSVIVPYSGGELDPDRFEITEYPKRREEASYDVFVIVSQPVLQDIERRALELIPAELDDVSFAVNPSALPFTVTRYVVVVTKEAAKEAVRAVTRGFSPAFHADLQRVRLSPDRLEELGVEASARELLRLRAEVLEEYADEYGIGGRF
jgi:hypothetical protein